MKSIHILFLVLISFLFCSCGKRSFDLKAIEKERILNKVNNFIDIRPVTVADSFCIRSAGTRNDFYSEGDYWWPNPEDPNVPYIRRDGISNPDNFKAHRRAIIRLNHIAGCLASAYILSDDNMYLKQIVPHLEAWFVNPETKMNPNLLYAQAIQGKTTGRGIGIIDTVHLVEVALAVEILEKASILNGNQLNIIKQWFDDYKNWLIEHPFGKEERDNGNNHSVCWAVQIAAFSRLVNDEANLNYCKTFYKKNLLPNQMASNGSFPKELNRTKPFGYSLFNLDAMSNLCQLLSTKNDNLFEYKTEDGRSLELGLQFLYPFINNKSDWPYKEDVMCFDNWPVRQSALLFGGKCYKNKDYLELWEDLEAEFEHEEIERNMPVKYPLLWFSRNY
ncbi:alginate lyase family protein [Aestuariibaculum suncheonense]|uniref:Alginate lyase family protein n=1 Tax=Aestuariibaculum suncheonense TaxID=1028745 RepID=A0A8J6UAU4_9FLAO|nr:alginate lyase family protein [Aestuariibaculum suncheonense]MBD0834767.1 alginate lyase family protein [Aestuariibaculum suncheonense]